MTTVFWVVISGAIILSLVGLVLLAWYPRIRTKPAEKENDHD